ncbi:MAG: glycosyltransferase family 39 protein [Parvularculaceae bacterium]
MTGGPAKIAARYIGAMGYGRALAAIIVLTTFARVIALIFNAYDLGPDETQYWFWSLTPDWGYFSKPPLIAWLIGASTALFGDAEWAIRLPAPLLHAGSAWFLYLLGKSLYADEGGARIGFWGALIYFFSPGVILSSNLITTDAPLLFFWSAALLALHKSARRGGWSLPVILGLCAGLGFLAKYAMIYFTLGASLAAIVSPEIRKFCLSLRGASAILVAAAIAAPNLYWNAVHDFSTISHTAANANWGTHLFNPAALAKFLLDQFGVFGPIAFGAFLAAAFFTIRRRMATAGADLYLLAFAAPPLLLVAVQAFISRAHANWAAAAYPAASLLVAAFLFRTRRIWLAQASVVAQAAGAALLAILLASPSLTAAMGLAGVPKRISGWEAQGGRIAEVAAAGDYDAIMADDREIIGALLYYVRPRSIPIIAWNMNIALDNHYEYAIPHDRETHKHVLLVTTFPNAGYLAHEPAAIAKIGEDAQATGAAAPRVLHLFDVRFTE